MKREYFDDFASGYSMKTFIEVAHYANLDMLTMKYPKCRVYDEHIG